MNLHCDACVPRIVCLWTTCNKGDQIPLKEQFSSLEEAARFIYQYPTDRLGKNAKAEIRWKNDPDVVDIVVVYDSNCHRWKRLYGSALREERQHSEH